LKSGDYRPRDYVNSTLLKTRPRRHHLLPPPPHMAQQHSPPYSSPSPSPMWLIVVSSTVVTHHRGRPQQSSSSSASSISSPPPSPLYCRRSSSSFPHFPLGSPSPQPSLSSSYLPHILFDCCVVVRPRVVSLLLLKILASTGTTLLSPYHRLSILSALAISPI
jgi:hypothetical protein